MYMVSRQLDVSPQPRFPEAVGANNLGCTHSPLLAQTATSCSKIRPAFAANPGHREPSRQTPDRSGLHECLPYLSRGHLFLSFFTTIQQTQHIFGRNTNPQP